MALQPLGRGYEGVAVHANGYRDGGGRGIQWVEQGAEGDTLEGRMEEDTELEEGETVEGGLPVDDLDARTKYLDRKIEDVLGDCQKDFEGSLFNDKLGSKVGIYGSFLPTHVRGPPVLSGPAPALVIPPRSRLLEGQMERARRIAVNGSAAAPDRATKLSPNGPEIKRQINGVHHSGDGFASVPAKGNKRKDGFPADQKQGRSITLRLNLGKGTNKVEKKTLYNGFGLDNSSSPSTDEDPDDALSASEDESSPDRSPWEMIRFMTSFEVPGDGLLSPLGGKLDPPLSEVIRDVFVGVGRKEKPLPNTKSSRKQVTSSHALKPEPGPGPGPVATKQENEADCLKAKEESTKDLKSREPSVETNLKETAAKEGAKEKRKMGGNKDALKAKRDEEAFPKDSQKQQHRKDVGKQVEPVMVVEKEVLKDGPLEVKKKGKESSKGPQTQKEAKDKASYVPKDGRRETKKESSKKEVLRDVDDSGKDEPKESARASVRELPKEVLKDLGKRDSTEQGLKDVKAGKKAAKKGGMELKAVSKEGERDWRPNAGDSRGPGGDDIGDQPPAPQPLLTPLPPAGPAPGTDAPAGVIVPAGQLVLDHWVQCDNCQHWRLLIPTIHPDDLPDNWLCKMMTWLPGLNNCKFPEDVTTAAVYKLLGLQNPAQVNPSLQAQQHPLAPALATSSGLIPDNKILDSKPVKVNRSASKKGMGKKVPAGTVKNSASNMKRMEANSGKSRSLNDVGQHPVDHQVERTTLETVAAEHGGYGQVPVDNLRKVKQKERSMSMWEREVHEHEGDGFHLHKHVVREQGGSSPAAWPALQELGKAVKLPVTVEVDNGADKIDNVVGKRKKKTEAVEEEFDEVRPGKKSKVDGIHNTRAVEAVGQSRAQAVGDRMAYDDHMDTHSLQYGSEEGAIQEGESGDRTAVNSRRMKDKEVSGKGKLREKEGQLDGKKRPKGDETGPDHQIEKRRIVSKPDSKDWGPSREVVREEKKGQVKRVGISPRTEFQQHNVMEEQSREAESPRNERLKDARGKNARLFDEISGIARAYAPESFVERADESPNGESPLPDLGTYTEQAERRKGGSQLRSPPSSSSKVSYSAASSAFGSKGGSPLESTVSSSPLRSSKVNGAATGGGLSGGVPNNHTTSHSHPSDKLNSGSPSPKRSLDQEADAHSDQEGALQQSHRNWDDMPHSSDHEREFRGSVRDPARETASGRGRDDRYATSTSREGADFRKFDRNRPGRDDDRFWEEGRETRAGSASYFPDRDHRHRDERYREREDSVDRYRDRENRYERRSGREERFRERDKERDRERDRSRENWAPDRSGDIREERYSREKSVRQDRGARPSSRESRLDKQGTWHDDSRLIRDVGREGRDRLEDDNAEIKHEIRSNHVEDPKDDHPGEDEHDAPDVPKEDSGHGYEKNDLGPPKGTKSNFVRAPNPGQASHGWEGDKVGVAFSVRKDLDAGAPRSGSEAQAMTTHVNSRGRVDTGGQGSTGVRGKAGQVDGAPLDVRIVEDAKQGKEHKKGADEERVTASKALSTHITRPDGASSSFSKKEHATLAKSLSEEARHLKHSADRMKILPAMEVEIPNLYLQASLKFLQSAHHFEMASVGERQGYTSQSIQLYNETARFFDFCATTYERQRDLAAAALAHNCAAVARFRGLMGKSTSLNKDCMELQNAVNLAAAPGNQVAGVATPPTGLPPPPPLALSRASEKPRSSHGGPASVVGESPSSSSASDVDNLNNHALIGEKGLPASAVKGAAPSLVPGSVSAGSTELVPQRLHGSLTRMIRNGTDLFAMMESWTKAQNATAAAETACAGDPQRQEGMVAVRRVVEIGVLGNMDAVVRQVRLALEAIGQQ